MAAFSKFRIVLPLTLLLLIGTWAFAEFLTPSKGARATAVGSLVGMDELLRRSFLAEEDFEAKKAPQPSDWLAQRKEDGQTYSQYRDSKPNRPGAGGRNTLYILPLGDFPEETAPDLATLEKYMEHYYYPMPVKLLPNIREEKLSTVGRINNFTGQEQWHAGEMLRWLPSKLPKNCYGLLAVTMTDLYPGEDWNFVFGLASYRERVGIFSFARFRPSQEVDVEDKKIQNAIVLRRACKVLSHEMGHMFGIKHCVHYECNMNGANSLSEADSTPMHLCPVCLRKLQQAVGFDPLARYQGLKKFYLGNGFASEEKWLSKRMKWIEEG